MYKTYGGGQTVATGGDIQGADTSGGVSGNPAGDFTGDTNSTPTSVKPVVEPTSKPATKTSSGAISGGDTRMGAASTGVVAGGDTRMGAASTGKLPPDTSGGVTSDPTYRPKTATPPVTASSGSMTGAVVPTKTTTNKPATAAPQSYDNLSFNKAFAAARKAAGGAGGVFMWKGKPYQTNI